MSEVSVRRAGPGDAGRMAEVWIRSYAAALPGVRRGHTDQEVRDWFAAVVVPERESWVAVHEQAVHEQAVHEQAAGGQAAGGQAAGGGDVVGLLVLGETELEQLYLEPGWRGRGIGDRFVELAKRQRPDGLTLWTFQVNQPARRFYERHGFVAVERTDGSANEEHEPDIRYAWR